MRDSITIGLRPDWTEGQSSGGSAWRMLLRVNLLRPFRLLLQRQARVFFVLDEPVQLARYFLVGAEHALRSLLAEILHTQAVHPVDLRDALFGRGELTARRVGLVDRCLIVLVL